MSLIKRLFSHQIFGSCWASFFLIKIYESHRANLFFSSKSRTFSNWLYFLINLFSVTGWGELSPHGHVAVLRCTASTRVATEEALGITAGWRDDAKTKKIRILMRNWRHWMRLEKLMSKKEYTNEKILYSFLRNFSSIFYGLRRNRWKQHFVIRFVLCCVCFIGKKTDFFMSTCMITSMQLKSARASSAEVYPAQSLRLW